MLSIVLILLGAAFRLLPHSPNFVPITGLALFGGIYLNRRTALLIPLAAMVVSDYVLGFGSLRSRLIVYGTFALIGLVGFIVKQHKNPATIIAAAISGSLIFFLTTNFVYFYPPTMYPHTLAGLLSSYYNALPFLKNTLLGDLFFTTTLCGAYELAHLTYRHHQPANLIAAN